MVPLCVSVCVSELATDEQRRENNVIELICFQSNSPMAFNGRVTAILAETIAIGPLKLGVVLTIRANGSGPQYFHKPPHLLRMLCVLLVVSNAKSHVGLLEIEPAIYLDR